MRYVLDILLWVAYICTVVKIWSRNTNSFICFKQIAAAVYWSLSLLCGQTTVQDKQNKLFSGIGLLF